MNVGMTQRKVVICVEYWCATQKLCALDNDVWDPKVERAKY
jgi:hypothetical protein